MKSQRFALPLVLAMALVSSVAGCSSGGSDAATAATRTVEVSVTGGHDTSSIDGGRPVSLVAGALGVPPEVFREAFSNVKPAGAGEEPDPEQVNLNKQALLDVLGPYGVTNERLDEVSDYYRYNGSAGENWPATQAMATATVEDGAVTGLTITDPGSGYSSAPTIVIPGVNGATAAATIAYTADLATNGSLSEIRLG